VTEPTITCPNCKIEIKLTESLAAPIIESSRKQLEQAVKQKEAELESREASIRERQTALDQAKESIEQRVIEKVAAERKQIEQSEARKARQLLATDIEQKDKALIELQEVLKHGY
jgi:hypothetical protein